MTQSTFIVLKDIISEATLKMFHFPVHSQRRDHRMAPDLIVPSLHTAEPPTMLARRVPHTTGGEPSAGAFRFTENEVAMVELVTRSPKKLLPWRLGSTACGVIFLKTSL